MRRCTVPFGPWLPALAVLVAAGCGAAQPRSPFNSRSDRPDEIRILVRNLNFNQARLYAVSGGRRIRLGTVGGNQEARYTIDWNFSQPLVIEINLVAGGSCSTRPIPVDPGDIIELQIESNFRRTSYCR